MVAAKKAGQVLGVEVNRDAVRDARENAKLNRVKNIRFVCADAGDFMVDMANAGEHCDVLFMDPPRAGQRHRVSLLRAHTCTETHRIRLL